MTPSIRVLMNLCPRCFSVLLVLQLASVVMAQEELITPPEERHVVHATARVLENGVDLRWYPGSAGIWRHANQHGYLLERMEISESGQRAGWKTLTGQPIKPYSAQEWRDRTDQNNDYVNVASRAILEPTPPAVKAPFETWKEYQAQENGVSLFFTPATNLHQDAALGAALCCLDTDIETGKGYVYRISVPTWKGEADHRHALVLVEDTCMTYIAPVVTGVRVVELEGAVRIFWPIDPNDALFPACHIERSKDGKQWQQLNRLPLLFGSKSNEEIFFIDSVANYQPYFYRVVGMTPFADRSEPSSPIKAMGRDLTPPAGATHIRAEGNRQRIKVTWELPHRSPI